MKKTYLFLILLTITACVSPEIENDKFTLKNVAKETDSKITDNNLFNLQKNLLDEYYQQYTNENQNLENIINQLDSITTSNLEFQNLKIINYYLPSTIEINSLTNTYEIIYENLNITNNCKSILDQLINKQIDINSLEIYTFEADLDQSEKELLFFIAHNIKDKNDPDWNKKKTIFIVNGYHKQPVSAVFNACLFEVLNH